MKVAANTLRKGMVIEYNNKLWVVMENELRSPGKGAAVAQVVMRDIIAGTKMDIRFATQDMVERARVMVPPHIEAGTRIVVRTGDASYVERAKD